MPGGLICTLGRLIFLVLIRALLLTKYRGSYFQYLVAQVVIYISEN